MTARPMRDADLPVLAAMAADAGYPYPEIGPNLEAIWVVAGDDDVPLVACAAEKILQLYLYRNPVLSPAATVGAMRILHEGMGAALKSKGWGEVNAFVPPEIAESFGRRLSKSFGFARNWVSFFKKL